MSEPEIESAMWPSYALRAWVGALLAQTRRAREDLEARIDAAEKEVARLRRQHERAGSVIESLQGTIQEIDARLSRIRDIDLPASAGKREEAALGHDTERGGPEGIQPEPSSKEPNGPAVLGHDMEGGGPEGRQPEPSSKEPKGSSHAGRNRKR
jgi:hypothetical protein